MADKVFMDIPKVKEISKNFQTFGETLDMVGKIAKAISDALKTVWFVRIVSEAVIQFIDQIFKPQCDKMSQKCKELSQDVMASVTAYERGDQQGATKFY